jgi:hypothetical protein
VRGGGEAPYSIRYGAYTPGGSSDDVSFAPPDYDYARLPVRALELDHVTAAALGPEIRLRSHEPRSYRWLVTAGLALAALVVGAAGIVALRRNAPG